jgi:hypothetical protein
MSKEEKRVLDDMEKIRQKRTSAQQGIKSKYMKRSVSVRIGLPLDVGLLTYRYHYRKRPSRQRNALLVASKRPQNGERGRMGQEVYATLVDYVSNCLDARN